MRVISWNVNGLRSVYQKGFLPWFEQQDADAVCLQEVKAHPEQLDPQFAHPKSHQIHWCPAVKRGYSGNLIYTRREPQDVRVGLGRAEFDSEGRWLEVDLGSSVLISSYFPNSQRDHARLGYKLEFCAAALARLSELRARGRHVILCGDFNIAHREIDLCNPKTNKDNAGFLPEERAWFDSLVEHGFIDVFRNFEPGGGHYTWWSYRPTIRSRNIGWRLDYFVVNPESKDRLVSMRHQTSVMGSDHCPIELVMRD